MTRYTVTWWNAARDDLAQLWLEAPDKGILTNAANAIDQELSVDPQSKGAPSHEGLRRFVVTPLQVQFSVEENDRRVTVWSVKLT